MEILAGWDITGYLNLISERQVRNDMFQKNMELELFIEDMGVNGEGIGDSKTALAVRNNLMAPRSIKARDNLSLFVRSYWKLSLIPIEKRLFHTDNRMKENPLCCCSYFCSLYGKSPDTF